MLCVKILQDARNWKRLLNNNSWSVLSYFNFCKAIQYSFFSFSFSWDNWTQWTTYAMTWWPTVFIILKSWVSAGWYFPCSRIHISGKIIIVLMVFMLLISYLLWRYIKTLIFCETVFEEWLEIKFLVNKTIGYYKEKY